MTTRVMASQECRFRAAQGTLAAMIRQGEVSVDGVRSPTIEAGPEGAHRRRRLRPRGNPGSTHDWEKLVEAVETHGRAISLDMPGFGEADKPDDFPYDVEGYAAHLGGALEQLGVERAHLVLHDFGGAWGMQWAVDHPDAYASTTLIDTGMLLGYRWHAMARIWRTRRGRRALLRAHDTLGDAQGAQARAAAAAARRSPRPLLSGQQGQGHPARDPAASTAPHPPTASNRWPPGCASSIVRPSGRRGAGGSRPSSSAEEAPGREARCRSGAVIAR